MEVKKKSKLVVPLECYSEIEIRYANKSLLLVAFDEEKGFITKLIAGIISCEEEKKNEKMPSLRGRYSCKDTE